MTSSIDGFAEGLQDFAIELRYRSSPLRGFAKGSQDFALSMKDLSESRNGRCDFERRWLLGRN